jgi:hypothetical protein
VAELEEINESGAHAVEVLEQIGEQIGEQARQRIVELTAGLREALVDVRTFERLSHPVERSQAETHGSAG